ncbi:MAG: phosphoglucosamine mutase [Chthonomonas sp.]|nr:phosphoglucosamine mutase [Chthonomonas sp.]
MSGKRFGTDGIRGVANRDLTPDLCLGIGYAAGKAMLEDGLTPRAVLGRDTRLSGTMLGAALAAGFCSAGVEAVSLGVAPTGAISHAARVGDFGLAAVISASHNPAPDNGIKLIAHDGRKVSEEFEARVEAVMHSLPEARVSGGQIGRLVQTREPLERYMTDLEPIVPEGLSGLRIAVDGSHGAGHELGPEIFRRLGAEVHTIGVEPDGMNINAEGGATKPHTIQEFTKSIGAHIGVAFDGDADRAVFSDEQGRLINGDRTIALWCGHWKADLDPPVAVGTVMSNTGFERYLESQGIRLERTSVGDKYVSAKMCELGGLVGGEQSGHLIFSERGPTGDGLITALEVLRVLKRSGRAASEFYGDYVYWPQLLVNLRVTSKEAVANSEPIQQAVVHASERLGTAGRVNLRPSGTQPVVRLMVEAETYELRDAVSSTLLEVLAQHAGGEIEGQVDLTHALGD